MYVKITNCSNKKAWYLDRIGYAFKMSDVYMPEGSNYFVKHEGVNKMVLLKDAQHYSPSVFEKFVIYLNGCKKVK